MATVVAQASGNFSAGATWVGGVKPQPGDIAQTGNYTVTINEDFTGTLNPTGSGRFDVTTGGITITGDLVMASTYTGGGLRCTHVAGTVTLTGTATGGAGNNAAAVTNNNSGTLTVGTATGGSGGNAHGAYNNSNSGTLTVGTATGGSGAYAHGASNTGAGTLTVGTATGGSGGNAFGAYNTSTGICNVTLAVGNLWGPGGSHSNNTPGVYGSNTVGSTTTVQQIQFGAYGAAPIGGAVLLVADASNSAQFRTAYGGATKTLTDSSAAADYPAISDVRSGTAYANGDSTGTCAVPSANDVAYGIPVDATTGTAVLTAAGVRAAVGLAAANLDAQLMDGADKADVAAVTATVGAILVDTDATLPGTLALIKLKTDLLTPTTVGGLLTTPNQTVPLVAELGPAQTGLAIGYRVLRLDGTVFSAFTTAGVVETAVAGTYRAVNGIEAPGDGGTVIVGTAGADLREAAIESMLPMYGLGGGGIAFEYTLTNGLDGTPIADATVEVYSDAGMSTLVAIGETNALGVVMFYLDAGTYYLKRLKFGYDFVNPDVETVA